MTPSQSWNRRVAPLTLALLLLAPGAASAQTLTASEAVARALGGSPTLRASRADLDSASASVRAADGARVPTLTFTGDGQHSESFNVAANGIASSSQEQVSAGAAANLQTDLGTSIRVGLDTSVRWFSTNLDPTSTDLFRIGPIYSSALTIDLRQPLLRGAGTDATLGPRREAEARRLSAERSLDETTSQLALDTMLAHWELWYAQEALAIADEALAVARRQHDEAQLRHGELGTVAATEVLRYAAELARARLHVPAPWRRSRRARSRSASSSEWSDRARPSCVQKRSR